MVVKQNYLGDRVGKLGILVVITVIVQIIYAGYVRPTAEAWRAEQRAIAARTPGYTPERSIYVIIQDPEQQATIIVCIWAMILSVMRFHEIRAQRELLTAGYFTKDANTVIL
ncbi:MAG TPA: hypothetical protein VM692_05515, partial [Gammaproteobacteria bacterium]|nr:hypothetical protein [Gammaproteobacteria bacterium]